MQVNPLIATLGVGLFLQGILSASFTNFAGSAPKEFQAVAYGTVGFAPFSVIGLFVLAFLGWLLLRATKFGAHLYAVGGNSEGARLAGIRTDFVMMGAHALCSLCAGLTGLYLASRLRSGAPWVGRDGVYDLESIAGRRASANSSTPASVPQTPPRHAGKHRPSDDDDFVQHPWRLGLS